VLEALRRESGWDQPPPPGRARGVALGQRHVGIGATAVVSQLLPDGRIEVLTGAPEQGTGTYTVIQRLTAHALSVPVERVTVRHVDTTAAEPDAGVGGSRAATTYGNAALASGTALKARLEELAAEVMGWPAERVHLEDDTFRDEAGHSASFRDVADKIARGAPVSAEGRFDGTHGEVPDAGFCGYVVEVKLDRDTGQVRLHDVVFVGDVGTIINPVGHQGQIEGGFVYGLGSALLEELRIEDGKVTSANLGDYKLPSIADAPPLRTVLLPAQDGPGPLGGKAAGELTNTIVPAAIANALAALGARVTELPITAERVLAALR
jgi:CO/xanthine dehydrogenase Mo-binding subunit